MKQIASAVMNLGNDMHQPAEYFKIIPLIVRLFLNIWKKPSTINAINLSNNSNSDLHTLSRQESDRTERSVDRLYCIRLVLD